MLWTVVLEFPNRMAGSCSHGDELKTGRVVAVSSQRVARTSQQQGMFCCYCTIEGIKLNIKYVPRFGLR